VNTTVEWTGWLLFIYCYIHTPKNTSWCPDSPSHLSVRQWKCIVLTTKDNKKIITSICLIWSWRPAILHMHANRLTNERIAVDALLPCSSNYMVSHRYMSWQQCQPDTFNCCRGIDYYANSPKRIRGFVIEEFTIMTLVGEYNFWVNRLATIYFKLYSYP
jgi:hypothetical protein